VSADKRYPWPLFIHEESRMREGALVRISRGAIDDGRRYPNQVTETLVRIVHGGPGQSRTADQRFRKPLLYPSELQGHSS
jgi:hypothetical protein